MTYSAPVDSIKARPTFARRRLPIHLLANTMSPHIPLAFLSPGPGSLYLASAFLLIFWVWQFSNCWRRRDHPELFGSQKTARRIWLLSFLLFDPAQVILYVILVRTRFGRFAASTRNSSLVLLSLLIIAGLSYGVPFGRSDRSFVLTEASETSDIGFSLSVQASSSSQSSTTMRGTAGNPTALANIRVVCDSTEPVVITAAHLLCNDLAELPFVEKVEYVPAAESESASVGSPAPDLNIIISAGDIRTLPLPLFSRISGRVQVILAGGLDGITNTDSFQDRRLNSQGIQVEASNDFQFLRSGLAWGANRLGQPAGALRDWMREVMLEPMQEQQILGWPLGDYAGTTAYVEAETPKALLTRSATKRFTEYAPYVHNRTLWTYPDDRGTAEALGALTPELEAEGWEVSLTDSMLTARRGFEVLVAARPGFHERKMTTLSSSFPNDNQGGPAMSFSLNPVGIFGPIRVTYESRYSDEEMGVAVRELNQVGAPLVQLLQVKNALSEEQRQALLERMLEAEYFAPGQLQQSAQLARDTGNEEVEGQALRLAHLAVAYSPHDGGSMGHLSRRMKQLDISTEPPTTTELEQLGFIHVTMGDSLEVVVTKDQPARLFTGSPDAGSPDAGPTSLILTPIPDPGDPLFAYRIRRRGGSSTSRGEIRATRQGTDESWVLKLMGETTHRYEIRVLESTAERSVLRIDLAPDAPR
ncbi:MAG: hypothetical protein ACI8QS_000939 [Planctomycetota bacterium]|jgi:hypothetical protein